VNILNQAVPSAQYLLFRAVSTRGPDCLLPLAEREVIRITYHRDKKADCEDRISRNAVYFLLFLFLDV